MIKILLVIGFFIAWKVFCYLMYVLSVKFDHYYCTKMKWSMIKKLYPINPKKWNYNHRAYTSKSCYDDEIKAIRVLRYNEIPILLSFIDYQKLKFFSYKYGGQGENVRALQGILEDVQKDIEIKKKESERQIKQAEQMMKEAHNNGKNH